MPSRADASTSQPVLDLAAELFVFFRNEDGIPMARRRRTSYALAIDAAGEFGSQLTVEFYDRHEEIISPTMLTHACRILAVRARSTRKRTVHLRLADTGNSIIYDLARPDGTFIVMSDGRWRSDRRTNQLFQPTALTGEQVPPERGGSIEDLRELLNVSDADWDLYLGWLVSTFLPGIAHPILLVRGPQGSGKSTAMRLTRSLFDPSPVASGSLPSGVRDFAAHAGSSYALFFDNVHSLNNQATDMLCKAVTGDGIVDRTMYTNFGTSAVSFRRVIGLNGIDLTRLRSDIADRMVSIQLEAIERRSRRSESQLIEEFEQAKPMILGALFDLVAKVHFMIERVELDELPRMADFARVLAAMDEVLGTHALTQYLRTLDGLAVEVVQSDAVADAVVRFTEDDDFDNEWTGTPTELLRLLTASLDHPDRNWPTQPQRLSARLNIVMPSLESIGIKVTKGDGHRRSGGNRTRLITITRQEETSSRHSLTGTRQDLPGRSGRSGRVRRATPAPKMTTWHGAGINLRDRGRSARWRFASATLRPGEYRFGWSRRPLLTSHSDKHARQGSLSRRGWL